MTYADNLAGRLARQAAERERIEAAVAGIRPRWYPAWNAAAGVPTGRCATCGGTLISHDQPSGLCSELELRAAWGDR